MALDRRIGSYKDIIRAAWENRDRLPYMLRILRNGVCDGCALGTNGTRDWTQTGIHLCWIRLNLLRLNTVPPFDSSLLRDASRFERMSEREMRKLGRIPSPLIRRKGDEGFKELSWDSAMEFIASRMRNIDPRRLAFYLVSRGTVNETYYVAQKVARFLGTNNIDNSARICHAASTTGLKQTIGYAATTCSYSDLIGTDLIIFIGSNPANNQPVLMKYLHLAKKEGTKVAVINPYVEAGLQKYWVPSNWDSELFGTKIADAYFQISSGGDVAFLNGALKHMVANGWVDEDFIEKRTTGWRELVSALDAQDFAELERSSGLPTERMHEFARLYAGAKSAVLVWSMGVTQYRHGTSNVKAVVNLALARGMVGKPHSGLMPIRGHSGVQGGAEVGATPNQLPGGVAIDQESAEKFGRLWGFGVPAWKGYFVTEMIDAAMRGEIDVLYAVGGNLLSVLPDVEYCRRAIERVPLRVHHDIVLNPQMFAEPAETVIILPATTRYEMVGGNTETSTERRIIFNPEIPGARVPAARDEWQVLVDVAERVRPDTASRIHLGSTKEIREDIARAVPFYEGIQRLKAKGDQIQWGGAMLCENGRFNTPDGRARFTPLSPPKREIPHGWFQLSTRRGKQFNSIIFAEKDILSGAERDDVIMSEEDMKLLGVSDGETVAVHSETGEIQGRVRGGPISRGSIVMYWPEANALIRRGVLDPECGIPAYRDELVQVTPVSASRLVAGDSAR